jgi:hypothetical protein
MNNPRLASKKQNMKLWLCYDWVRQHRPDVIDAIQKEVNKKFPAKITQPRRLPESLRRLK